MRLNLSNLSVSGLTVGNLIQSSTWRLKGVYFVSVGRLPPIFPPVLPPSPYHSPLLPPLPSNNEIIFSSSLTVEKLIHKGHAIHLKFKPTIETKEKVRGCWVLHLLKAKQASGTLTRVSTLKIQFYYRCHHNRFATESSNYSSLNNVIFININCRPILWAYMNAGTSTLHPFFLLVLHPILFSSFSL